MNEPPVIGFRRRLKPRLSHTFAQEMTTTDPGGMAATVSIT